jgi:chemotaxis protein MotC
MVAAATALPNLLVAQRADSLEPYQMLRSLQFVQDTVIQGDHSAGEMQRFMLATIDQRLRTAAPSVFDDPRNVDAALIYSMSGGNPATLEYLVSKDTSGHFDNRVADVLRKYLNGKGMLVLKTLTGMVPEYRNQRIGPYLALVAGNVAVSKTPTDALAFYDWARLTAPGTIVEEAALRRSVAISVEADLVDKGLSYSRKYARRFVHSPYASQFADLFVQLVVKHFGEVKEQDIDDTLELMDADRSREILLRIARQAAIAGKNDLARLASQKVEARSAGAPPSAFDALAKLYGGVADLSTEQVNDAIKAMANVPDAQLSERDRAIRAAAQRVANEVVRPPSLESLGQDNSVTVGNNMRGQPVSASPGNDLPGPAGMAPNKAPTPAQKLDPDFQTYVDRGRSTLTDIDKMLTKGDKPR